MSKTMKIWRAAVWLALEAFDVATIVLMFATRQYGRLPMAFGSLLILMIPAALEWLLNCRFSSPLYFFALIYCVGPLIGQCYNCYYLIHGYDKLLHIIGGVIFTLFGLVLFQVLNEEQVGKKSAKKLFLIGLFALSLSMALSVCWEFVEFTGDRLLGMDMQTDTVLHEIRSYQLGNHLGAAGVMSGIEEVTVNGVPLPVDGYLDIGLFDTMWDMILETLAALAVVIGYWIDRGRHSLAAVSAAPRPRLRRAKASPKT